MTTARPELAALQIADRPAVWSALGFAVDDDGIAHLGGVEIWLDSAGRGITGWTIRHRPHSARHGDIDGLPTGVTSETATDAPAATPHPNGALGIDQVVVTTPDFDRTAAALNAAGIPLRRIRDAGGFRQGFRRLGPAILELVETPSPPRSPPAPTPAAARFWGLVVIVPDLDRLHARLAPHVGEVRPAVQPGRRIAALGESAGLSTRVALMDPE